MTGWMNVERSFLGSLRLEVDLELSLHFGPALYQLHDPGQGN